MRGVNSLQVALFLANKSNVRHFPEAARQTLDMSDLHNADLHNNFVVDDVLNKPNGMLTGLQNGRSL